MIPNKNITESEFNKIVHYQKINFGGEAIICESDNPFSLYNNHVQKLYDSSLIMQSQLS